MMKILRIARRFLFAASTLLVCSAAAAELEQASKRQTSQIKILPASFTLSGASSRQRVIVQNFDGDSYLTPVTKGLKLTSANPKIAKIENDVVIPVANGTTIISASADGFKTRAKVTVTHIGKPTAWSFRNHVQPVLTKGGCNSGACHGAAAGKNGFKLSLRGYDDLGDFLALTRHAFGRRIVPSDPARSLLVLKPLGLVPHKGGKIIDIGSPDFRILTEWIAAGTPAPSDKDVRITRVEVLPGKVQLQPGDTQQVIVLAHFDDGHFEDVTRWVKYSSSNEEVARVNKQGELEIVGYGEGAIVAWYLSRIAIATISVPFPNKLRPEVFTKATRKNFIDDLVLEKLRDLNLPPSERCTDAEFIRRVYLDITGTLPAPEKTRAFLADKSNDKRDRLIDALLSSTEYVDYWSYKWSELLLVNSGKLIPGGGGNQKTLENMWSYYRWIRSRVERNTPWDEFTRELVTARGSTLENGAANFFVLHDDPKKAAENTSVAFLGMSINCAQCHNHPLEKWTNDDYFSMANLFARVRRKDGTGPREQIVFSATSGNIVQPLTGRPQPPQPLDGSPLPLDGNHERRSHLAEWLTSSENPYFTRAIVNRVWANYFGVGLVEKVDDMRASNPPSNDKLLGATADFLVKNGYDLKSLMRTILQSETYQRSSVPTPGNENDKRFYSRYYPKRMIAEVMLDSISHATGVPTEFKGYPKGWRAVQLPDSNIDSYFLSSFGRPEREATCTCERTSEPSVSQVLHIANGSTLNQKLSAKENDISRQLAAGQSPEKIIDELYLKALSRLPTKAEKNKLTAMLKETKGDERRKFLEDIYWAVLSSKEFLFNH